MSSDMVNTTELFLLAIAAFSGMLGAVLKLFSDSRERQDRIDRDKKLTQLQNTADNTHKLVNSESEKQLQVNITTLKALAIAMDRIAHQSGDGADSAAAKAAHSAVEAAESVLVDHRIAQAGVDGAEQQRRES